jgi:2,3-diketo-5-methylthio-1-phosphopentane phosphatase
LSAWLIVVDFDGTITEQDTLDWLVRRHAPEVYDEVETALLAGEITLHECIRREFEAIRGDHDEIVGEAVEAARVRPGFAEFATSAEERGDRVVVVSSGFEQVIRPVLAAHGLDGLEVVAHRVQFTPEQTTVEFRHGDPCPTCGQECKRSVVDTLRNGRPVAYVGDGYSDRCAALVADRRFARRGLARYLDGEGVGYVSFDDFYDVEAGL